MISIDEAIHILRADPDYADLVRDAYFDRDVVASAKRFSASNEFAEVLKIAGNKILNAVVVDVGAGTGIASFAFADHGASQVYAVEPDASDEVGRGAIQRSCQDLPVTIIDAFAENLPFADNSIDIYYGRQVLHHIPDLASAMREAARILKPGGLFIACREHVVDNEQQLAEFLAHHPMHQLAGGENAYPLNAYQQAIQGAGLQLKRSIAPLDSVINAFPYANSDSELQGVKRTMLQHKLGPFGTLIWRVPLVNWWITRFQKRVPGRVYSFVAVKQMASNHRL